MLHTRLATMDAGIKKDVERSSHQMHTSTSVLGTRSRTMGDTMGMGPAVYGDIEKRPRGEALEIAFAVDLEVANGRDQL